MSYGYEPLLGGTSLFNRLRAITARATDFTPAFALVVTSFRAITKRRFENNGPGWKELAPATVANRQRPGHNPDTSQILRDTGAMFESFMGGENSYVVVTPFSVEVGSVDPKAHYHQLGGTRLHASGAEWPPQRKIVDLGEDEAVEWAGIISGWLFAGERVMV